MQLHYFDNLLQKNMVGMAVCENPGMSPLVTCGTTSITVKLPHETKLKEVKELGKKWVFCCNFEVLLETSEHVWNQFLEFYCFYSLSNYCEHMFPRLNLCTLVK